jgi:hypothetical protein
MELTPQAAHYVTRFYDHLMTVGERKARTHLFGTMKASKGRSDETAQHQTQKHKIYSRMLSNEPGVLDLAKNGYEEFELRTAARILRDCGDKVFFNYCPICGGLARTPTAKQCHNCGHDWHAK